MFTISFVLYLGLESAHHGVALYDGIYQNELLQALRCRAPRVRRHQIRRQSRCYPKKVNVVDGFRGGCPGSSSSFGIARMKVAGAGGERKEGVLVPYMAAAV